MIVPVMIDHQLLKPVDLQTYHLTIHQMTKQLRSLVIYNSCMCDPNRQDEWGMTALHNACANRRPALVRYLVLECKCDPTVCDFQEDTTLHFACLEFDGVPGRDNVESDAVEIIKFPIEEQNCDPNVTNKMNQTRHIINLDY